MIDTATIGKTTHKALVTGADSVTLAANFGAAWIIADADCHITIDGSVPDQTSFYLKAGERAALTVQPDATAQSPLTGGGGVVKFLKHTGATDGNIWITEVA
jgi:hypothetical protein